MVHQDIAAVAVSLLVFVGETWVESGEAEACIYRVVADITEHIT